MNKSYLKIKSDTQKRINSQIRVALFLFNSKKLLLEFLEFSFLALCDIFIRGQDPCTAFDRVTSPHCPSFFSEKTKPTTISNQLASITSIETDESLF